MFKPLKRIVINNDSQLTLLEESGTLPSSAFNGWTANQPLRILPLTDAILPQNLVSIRRTVVTGSSALLAAGNYSAVTVTTPAAPLSSTAIIESTNVRRAAQQTATLTVDATTGLTAGANVKIKVVYRSQDRHRVEFNLGHKVLSTDIKLVAADIVSTTTLAARIRLALLELFGRNGDTKLVTVVAAANVLTITGFGTGIEFDIYTERFEETEYPDIPTTFAASDRGFTGMLDFYWMRGHAQDINSWYRLDTGETDFLPVKGAYYDSYFIKYRVNNPEGLWQEHQSGTINAEQSHIVDLQIYVKQGSDTATVRAALDLVGQGFA